MWQEAGDIQFDLNDLELTFATDSTPTTPSQMANPRKQLKVTTLLDMTRAKNIEIMLKRLKMGLPDIKRALLELNDAQLSIDDLKAIAKQLPTKDEVARVKDFYDISKLPDADQYVDQVYHFDDVPILFTDCSSLRLWKFQGWRREWNACSSGANLS